MLSAAAISASRPVISIQAEPLELKALAAGEHGGRQLVGLGGGEDEYYLGRRLFQGLEQGIECLARQHVDFIDDVDAITPLRRDETHFFPEVAHFVDPAVAGPVDLLNVEGDALGDPSAARAVPAGVAVLGGGAIDRPGQDLGRRGLAGAPGAAKKVGVGHAVLGHGVAQGPDHVGLADEIRESLRPPFAI